ncbi:hypothetical protein CBR_g34299 [Chara braunii]|uniref:Uncharacterized protein n=1 Tax=Chara braunii TaxID=69332 RepID=A0A388JYR4_CHABU|nr:hypothetical protein CBR_g34299 [Chara braunii]|eukprot:GBG62928.1 hypothetical protein CBR_g34299 [Chara braunii]
MDRSVYDKMEAMTKRDHTIHPKNLADTGAAEGVQMPASAGAGGETMGSEDGGEAADEEQGSTKDSTFSAGRGGGYGKRKNMRQQTFEVVADATDKHGALMASTMDRASKRQCSMMLRQCEILESEVEVQRKHYVAADEANRMIVYGRASAEASKGLFAPRGRWVWQHMKGVSAKEVWRGAVTRVAVDDGGRRRIEVGAPPSTPSNEEEDDDVFTTEEEATEDTLSAPRGSTLQRSSDQNAARRLLTPPPEAQQVRAHNTPKAKEVVVDVGGEDDEPLESRRQRNVTQGATATTFKIRGATEERPPQGGLPSTPSQPRPHNTAAEGGSMECGGGEGAQQEARVASGGAIGGAAAGSSGNVAAVSRAREELPVVEREVARGDNKGDREDEDPLLSRVRRGGTAKDLAERACLWVDDKAFWTTGEGTRLYNIVHETQQHFVAIANGLQAPAVPWSVVMPKSAMSLTRIADPAQLQQAISRAMTAENIALRVLHGWVFKSGNRPQGYNVAYHYVLESVATDITRAMWYGEEWSNVVSAALCAHTINLNMDLPLWFAGANIEDRPEDDDMAAHQESTVICIVHAFRAAVQMGGNVDGGFISHDRLSRIADCFRLLLAASMWLMRMAGDDPELPSHQIINDLMVAVATTVNKVTPTFSRINSTSVSSDPDTLQILGD